MFRSTAALALTLVVCTGAWAQLIIRPPPPGPPQPQGVIQPVSLPIPGSLTPPSPVQPNRPLPMPYYFPYTYYDPWGYGAYWPTWYDYNSPLYAANYTSYVQVPVPAQAAPVSAPQPPPDTRARLTLNVPPNAEVWVGGTKVDAAATPIILQSPELREGQRYSFDLKVTWKERDKKQERTRTVVVDGGDNKSLTYNPAPAQ
jgi:uncharacterized protein (TIGR03000 family)